MTEVSVNDQLIEAAVALAIVFLVGLAIVAGLAWLLTHA